MDQLLNNSYDVIIVGAGTAGCVVANRLTELPTLRVLLIEAGSDHSSDDAIRIPGLFTTLHGDERYDWAFVSEPEAELNGRKIRHPRGKLVGGSSAINSHALIYPSKLLFNAWKDFGIPEWNWEVLQPYFHKFLTVDQPSEEIKKKLHLEQETAELPKSGPIHGSYPMTTDAWREAWDAAHEEMGAPMTGTGYLGDSHGGGTTMAAVDQETRERSHAGLYYRQAKERPNLFLASSTLAERIIFDTSHNPSRASGVQVVHDGRQYVIPCSGDVILCAGAFQSPQLLELSGIGDRERLQSLGIDVIYNNPRVGEGLQDHINCSVAIETHDTDGPKIPLEKQRAEYDLSKTGPLAEASAYSFAYEPLLPYLDSQSRETLLKLFETHAPSVAKVSYPSELIEYDFIRSIIENSTDASATTLMIRSRRLPLDVSPPAVPDSGKYFGLIAMLAYPLSRGSVHIKSGSATDLPEVKFNYLSHPLDSEILARHLLAFDRLLDTQALRGITKPCGRRYTAGNTVEEAITYLRSMARTNYHPCGTCAMMSKELGGVVNERFKVYGVQGLRVVDASVFPLITRGNILATVYAVAERAGDVIKADFANPQSAQSIPG